MTFEIPEGKAAGLLPRESRWGELIPAAAVDRVPDVPSGDWIAQPNLRWLENWSFDIDQNGYSSCTCCALAHVISFLISRSGVEVPELDWLKFYHTFTNRGGVALDSALYKAMQEGYPIVGGGVVNVTEAYDADSLGQLGSALQRGFPYIYGHDGHCEAGLTLDRTMASWLIDTRNSWGRSWGDKGWHQFALGDVELERYGVGIVCAVEIVKG